jgi:hypothetical protein
VKVLVASLLLLGAIAGLSLLLLYLIDLASKEVIKRLWR